MKIAKRLDVLHIRRKGWASKDLVSNIIVRRLLDLPIVKCL
jgi:hypothetical protein